MGLPDGQAGGVAVAVTVGCGGDGAELVGAAGGSETMMRMMIGVFVGAGVLVGTEVFVGIGVLVGGAGVGVEDGTGVSDGS